MINIDYNNIDYYELFFTLLVSILIITILYGLLWHNSYKSAVKSSRCYLPASTLNKIHLVAKDKYDEPMYKVKYDLKKRSASIKCACTEGDIINTFRNINYFDINYYKTKSKDLNCSCSEKFNLVEKLNTYYYGTPGLIRYMENENDTSVFDPAYYENISK